MATDVPGTIEKGAMIGALLVGRSCDRAKLVEGDSSRFQYIREILGPLSALFIVISNARCAFNSIARGSKFKSQFALITGRGIPNSPFGHVQKWRGECDNSIECNIAIIAELDPNQSNSRLARGSTGIRKTQ
ncbi:hypothetical protein BC89_33695 [Pseudomonas monteilii]|nr:hypothetical protein BC89_33695 [Pseudomonas monteilii]